MDFSCTFFPNVGEDQKRSFPEICSIFLPNVGAGEHQKKVLQQGRGTWLGANLAYGKSGPGIGYWWVIDPETILGTSG